MNELLSSRQMRQEQVYQLVESGGSYLQMILYPNQSIYTCNCYITYHSPNLQLQFLLRPELDEYYKAKGITHSKWYNKACIDTKVANKSETIAYIGLSKSKGRIIAIDPNILRKMLVNEQYVLSYTENCILISQDSYPFGKGMYAIKKLHKKDKFSGYVYIQSNGSVIEKMLGIGEEIYVMPNAIIAHQKSVTRMHNKNGMDVWVGPGLLMFTTEEINPSKTTILTKIAIIGFFLCIVLKVGEDIISRMY